jgi:hypothetical protein
LGRGGGASVEGVSRRFGFDLTGRMTRFLAGEEEEVEGYGFEKGIWEVEEPCWL